MLSLVTSVAGEFLKCDVKFHDCWVLHSISIAILLSWMQMMLLIGRFPTCGYYALMFSTVLKNILKVSEKSLYFMCLADENKNSNCIYYLDLAFIYRFSWRSVI